MQTFWLPIVPLMPVQALTASRAAKKTTIFRVFIIVSLSINVSPAARIHGKIPAVNSPAYADYPHARSGDSSSSCRAATSSARTRPSLRKKDSYNV